MSVIINTHSMLLATKRQHPYDFDNEVLTKLIQESFPSCSFPSSSSIVIIGLRGVGKSTLSLMASASLRYHYIELERCVYHQVGISEQDYIQKYSLLRYREQECTLISQKLLENSENSIIVIPTSSIDFEKTYDFLMDYGRTHPIININSEESRILNYIKYEGDNGIQLINSKLAKYKTLCNFEFFNYHASKSPNGSFNELSWQMLTLKTVERDFVRFLNFIIGGWFKTSIYLNTLHLAQPEDSNYSNIVVLKYPDLLDDEIEISELVLGADCIEIAIDISNMVKLNFYVSSIDQFIAKIRRNTSSFLPILLSVSSLAYLSQNGGDQYEYLRMYMEILSKGVKFGLDYLDLDLNLINTLSNGQLMVSSITKAAKNTKIVLSYNHVEESDVSFWSSTKPWDIINKALELNCSIVRISKTCANFSENYQCMNFRTMVSSKYPNIKLICFNNGNLGKLSKILNLNMTPVIPNIIDENTTLNVGNRMVIHDSTLYDISNDLSAKQHQIALHSSFVTPSLKYYVMGSNISYSLSPAIHNAAYQALGLPHEFRIFESSSIDDLHGLVNSPNFGGTGVIMPFKLEAMSYVDCLSDHSARIGALNTIIAERSLDNPNKILRIRGENTDWLGVRLSITANISPINSVTRSKTALLLGAGGMSRASLYALISMGVSKILLYNRTESRAIELADHFNSQSPMEFVNGGGQIYTYRIEVLKSLDLSQNPLPDGFQLPTIIICCIPGRDSTTGNLINFQLPDEWFESPSGGVVLDTGYDPLLTAVLIKARNFHSKGWIAVNGLNYLYAQSLSQFELFTGKPAPRILMRRVAMRHFAAYNKTFLD